MEEILKNIIFAAITAILTIIAAILVSDWLEKIGAIRHYKNGRIAMIILGLFFVLTKLILFNATSWWLWGIGIFLGATLAFNRGDLSRTIADGRWWWKQSKENKRREM